ncbi:hypothetical protein N7457_002684 [Penicillium paradoxum]|uniref:uncharacterized protein n=1 Tax=Penicillium paradoxum TaxID=176176 RepID=UPI0025495677|nr:uncharacterized protein N7457_002684 [Penicillium paradoxum]KAJ5787694.1 hypothetical protein N7457_002684 [Penicillium paradoxum]
MGKIKWDSVADKILVAILLQTHELSIDFVKIADAWPAKDDEAKPTPRAIRERIFKIKELGKANAAAAGGSSPVTPKKRTPRKKNADTTTLDSPVRKRKRVTKTAADDDETVNTDDVAIKQEADLADIDPLLHSHADAETADAETGDADDHGKDADWSPEQEDDLLADSTSERLD